MRITKANDWKKEKKSREKIGECKHEKLMLGAKTGVNFTNKNKLLVTFAVRKTLLSSLVFPGLCPFRFHRFIRCTIFFHNILTTFFSLFTFNIISIPKRWYQFVGPVTSLIISYHSCNSFHLVVQLLQLATNKIVIWSGLFLRFYVFYIVCRCHCCCCIPAATRNRSENIHWPF